jgi:hypothetical protein
LHQNIVAGSQKEKCGVCNAQSEGQVRASETTDFEGGHPGAHLISIERHKERQ